MSLNPAQLEAVNYTAGPLLVLAGAGSGKTRVITHKIGALVAGGVPAYAIAAVTFTNKAAREMRQRAATLLDKDTAKALKISTFHTLGLNILRREYGNLGYKRGFTIFDAHDSRALVKELLRSDNADTDAAVDMACAAISSWKSELVDPPTALATASDDIDAARARQYAAYQRALQAYNALDFDDLIARPVFLFRELPQVLAAWQDRIRYMLGDEYQDTNQAQYQLMSQLVGARGAFTVVGDDDQSIYAWRGARPDNLKRLAQDFPALRVIKLEQNYRSSSRILEAANGLIANNPHLFEKRLWSAHGPGDRIRVMAARDGADEADRVAMEIMRQRMERGGSWGDFAVLYRGNHQARPFEQSLRTLQIPYSVTGGTSFFDRSEVKDVLAYLRLIANPDDDAAFLRIVNVPRREIGTATLEKLGGWASERGLGLLAACMETGLHGVLPARAVERLFAFGRRIIELGDEAEDGAPVDELARELIEDIGYRDWLFENARDPRQAETANENLGELLDWLAKAARDDEAPTLSDALRRLSLMDMLDREAGEGQDDRVRLMTLHAAKGLEFPVVFLAGCEEELLPHRANLEGPGLEEERRLAYVGITRAQRRLFLSYARRRKRFGETLECTPSRFLEELPADLLEWEGRTEVSAEEKKARGQSAIAGLRSLLGED
ncbi:UvrD-helicase domain-containing protein [Thioalkalivibrio sp. XN279]|uniref:UvrD-helicase domain-containing protein n=1 Tax=Thioalkalivibrio sp. XN279 TaxID=2714953 RepID=UPI00140C3C88|nr:UvrD-helicase domain-containing protein [Thioalkalivibrio sp. XN279]NHA13783.1 UvrD-helicase domain-containing protein [Thioalkalivibrio sp. XN279]